MNVSAMLCTVNHLCSLNAIIGHIVTEVSFYFCTPAEDGKTGFESVSYDGRPIPTDCIETVTFVQFRCNEQADWSTVADRNVTKYLVSAGFSHVDRCWVCYMSGTQCVLLFTRPLLKCLLQCVLWLTIVMSERLVAIYGMENERVL